MMQQANLNPEMMQMMMTNMMKQPAPVSPPVKQQTNDTVMSEPTNGRPKRTPPKKPESSPAGQMMISGGKLVKPKPSAVETIDKVVEASKAGPKKSAAQMAIDQ